MPLSPGTRLGPYEITSQIGVGGMGEVYRARDTRLDRSVAVKVLPSEFAANAQLRTRFEREARAISALTHPNICTLYDVGENYLVMELLEGENLAERLTRSPLPLPEVLRYGIEISEALDKAHRNGIVHRDLKPGNVIITKSGAKLVDFGLARAADASAVLPTAATVNKQQPLTAEGTIIGTFQYMAPEQLEGTPADARTDIFALGTLLYEMATAKRAFEGKTRTSLIAAIVSGQPKPMSQVQPLTPPALEHVVAKCLEKDPEARWQSAHDIAEELRWIRDSISPEMPARKGRLTARWVPWTIAVIALAAAGVLGWRELQARRDARAIVASIAPPAGMTFALRGPESGSLTVSPNGRYMTFSAFDRSGQSALWLRSLDSAEVRAIPGGGGEPFPFWSPDSRYIAYFTEGKLKKVDLNGSPPVTICNAPNGRSGAWNDDGVIIFSPDATSPIHRVSAAGGTPVPVTKLDTARGETTHRWATFLPDGRHFLYMAGTQIGASTSESNAVYLASLEGGPARLLLNARSNVAYASGHLLYLRERGLLAQPFDTRKLELFGEPFPIGGSVGYSPAYFRATFAVSDEGTLVYQSGATDPKKTLVWMDRKGNDLGTVGEPGYYEQVRLSPDERLAALTVEDPTSATSDIWIHDFDGKRSQRLTLGKADERDPVWSPDGRWLAFSDLRGGTDGVYVKPVDNSAPERLVLHRPGQKHNPNDWSPDGRYLAVYNKGVKSDILIVPVNEPQKTFAFAPTEFDEQLPWFSPDGKWVAYLSDEPGRSEVFVAPFPSGQPKRQLSSGERVLALGWSVHGLRYITSQMRMFELPVRPSAGGTSFGMAVPLFSVANTVSGDISRRSDRVLAIRAATVENQPLVLITRWPKLRNRS